METLEQIPPLSEQVTQPIIVSVPPPKSTLLSRFLIILFIIVIIAIAIFTYIYRYEIFESSWRHSMNQIETKYNADSIAVEKQFQPINNVRFLGTASSSPTVNAEYVRKVNALLVQFNVVLADIDQAKKYTSVDSSALSQEDATAKDLYIACFDGRAKATTLGSTALLNTSKYVQAYTLQQNYYTYDLKRFENSFAALSTNMKSGNMVAVKEGIPAARADMLAAKADIDGTATLLGYDSYKQEAAAYQLLIDGLDDIDASIANQDVSLVNKAMAKWKQATDLFQKYKNQSVTDLTSWLDNEVTAKYKDENAMILKMNDSCIKAESVSKPDKESTPVNKIINKLRNL